MKELLINIGASYGDYYEAHGEEKTLDFIFKVSSIATYVLNTLYNSWLKEGISPLESIGEDKKRKYWNIALKYFSTTEERIRASKSIYVIELITSTY